MNIRKANFTRDYDFGQKYEKLASQHIEPFDEIVWAAKCQFFDYDFKVRRGNTWFSYEVKADRNAYRTGNFYLEFECGNSPSGILKSKADFYIIFLVKSNPDDFEVHIIPTNKLKEQASPLKNKVAICNKQNDGMSKGYLVPLNIIC
jgi:hypothetical protein